MGSAQRDREVSGHSGRRSVTMFWGAASPCLALAWLLPLAAAEVPTFREIVQPLLEARCLGCHPEEGGRADLSLASLEDILQGGRSGPAVLPGAPGRSPLMSMISGESPAMPLAGEPLSKAEVDLIRRWIEAGAPEGAIGPPGQEPGLGGRSVH